MAVAPRRTKDLGARVLRKGAGLGAAAVLTGLARFLDAFGAALRGDFFAFARTVVLRRDEDVPFARLRDAMCRMPEIAAGAEAREMVYGHQGFNNRRGGILLLGQPPEARR
jgi:hypothetical protein